MDPSMLQPKLNSKAQGIGLKAALNILTKWDCSTIEKQAILGMAKSTFYKYQNRPENATLSHDQIERISYILNIHAALRIVFSNPENVYGFMKMPNQNSYFSGRTPLEIIATGQFSSLYEVFKRVDYMKDE